MESPARPWRHKDAALAAGCFSFFYLGIVLASAGPLHFVYDLGGYYNYLTRGFAEGQLHLPITPDPRLLAAANPQDPSIPMEWKMHDLVLYKGRYFLYHGAAPALLLFGPWRVLTGYDLPEAVAGWVFVSLGVWGLLILARPFTVWTALALGLGSGVLLILPRILVYEIAISCGFACLAWAFVMREEKEDWWAGLLLGLALLSRPHLSLAVLFFRWRSWAGLAVAGLLLASYNYLRFDSPFEFGLRYLLSGPGQQVPEPSLAKFWAAAYWLLLQTPEWQMQWPPLAGRWNAWFSAPEGQYHEPLIGGIFFAPFLWLAWRGERRYALSGALILSFICLTGWVTQRYLLDFLPWLVLASAPTASRTRWGRGLIVLGCCVALLSLRL